MKIFIDTADIEEIKEALSWGIVDGVTTNPSLMRKAIEKYRMDSLDEYVREILRVAGAGRPVSLEVMSLKAEDMIREAEILYDKFNDVANNVVIKVPVNTYAGNYEGLKTIKALSEKGIPVNCTLIMTPEQALLAAKAGARYVSPFAGRIDDYIRTTKLGMQAGRDFQKGDYYPWDGTDVDDNGIRSGSDLVEKTVMILDNYDYDTEVIASSIRNARQVRESALAGAHIATIPFKVIESMLLHPKTEEGVKKFSEDAEKANYREIFS
ncbi:MAG: transaldolase [Euryarchaeota archaeon]|nr:transaldolase [Euryarchaeota archaeon]